jgi:hypothetical protein
MNAPLDGRTAACVSTAWIIVFNKPFYPVYVWALIGRHAAAASLATLLFAPLYAAVPYLARRSARGARLALPLVGLADTLYATKMFGPDAGTELFLFPCALLAIVGFRAREAVASRILTLAVYVAFVALHGRYGAPLQAWAPDESARLFILNAFAVASLTAFIGLRFASVE